LDRLIQKVQLIDDMEAEVSEFECQLKLLLADQAIDSPTYQKLLETHLNTLKQQNTTEL